MPYPICNSGWTVLIDKKLTFFGVLEKYYDDIGHRYRLNQSTQQSYAKQYEKYIIPRLNDFSLEKYTAEDFEQVILDIAASETRCAQSTLQQYRRLIIRVIEMAVEKEGMPDPLWGTAFKPVTTPDQVRQSERRLLPKSLTVQQQCEMGEAIYSMATSTGANMGLLLAYEAGLRPKEVAGVSFGDYHIQDGFGIAAVHVSTIGQGNKRHGKMKTKNGFRKAVFGSKASNIILEKKEQIENLLNWEMIDTEDGKTVLAINIAPIAGEKENPLTPQSSVQISRKYRELLRDVGFENQDYLAAARITESDEFAEAERNATPEKLGFAGVKSPTVYINRRQFCTDMHIVGCTSEERQYSMGHRIENPAVDRKMYNNEDKLRELAEKLCKRPSINKSVLLPKRYFVSGDKYINTDFHDEHIRIPLRKGKIRIVLSSHEASTPVEVKLSIPRGVDVKSMHYECEDLSNQNQQVNVLNDYYDAFRQAYKRIEEKAASKRER